MKIIFMIQLFLLLSFTLLSKKNKRSKLMKKASRPPKISKEPEENILNQKKVLTLSEIIDAYTKKLDEMNKNQKDTTEYDLDQSSISDYSEVINLGLISNQSILEQENNQPSIYSSINQNSRISREESLNSLLDKLDNMPN